MKNTRFFLYSILACLPLLAISTQAHAALQSSGVLDQVVQQFHAQASTWQNAITQAATWLYWTLVTISMVWTFGMMALRKADIQEFFAEFLRFTIFTGFFWWLLINGPHFSDTIISGLRQLGGEAGGTNALTPSSIVDIGFCIMGRASDSASIWSSGLTIVGFIFSGVVLLLMAGIAVNMILLLVSGWMLAYAGIFFLGFGGSRWTSEMALNYYRTVLGIGVQLMTMILIISIGQHILEQFFNQMNKGPLNIDELSIMLVVSFLLYMLVDKVPALLAGVITGGGIAAGGGIGSFGAGAIVGGAMTAGGMAMAASQVAKASIASGSSQIAGGGSALMAAFKTAQAAEAGGADVMSSMARSFTGGGDNSDGPGGGGGSSPMDRAAGFDSSSPISFSGSGSSGAGTSASSGGGSSVSSGSGESGGSSGNSAQGGASSASSGSNGGTAQDGGSGSGSSKSGASASSGAGSGSSSGSDGSTLAKAGRIAAGTGANLARGVGAMVGDKVARTVEAAKSHVAGTVGGRLANEINNPGSLAQGRQDEKDIAAADSMKEQQRGEDACSFLAEQANPTFENNSLTGSGSEPVDFESEIADFVNRNDKGGD